MSTDCLLDKLTEHVLSQLGINLEKKALTQSYEQQNKKKLNETEKNEKKIKAKKNSGR